MLAEAAVAVVADQAAAVHDALGAAVGGDETRGQHALVVRQDRKAVARVAHAVGLDQVIGHVGGDVFGHRDVREHGRGEAPCVVDLDFHERLLADRAAFGCSAQIQPSQRHHVAANSSNNR